MQTNYTYCLNLAGKDYLISTTDRRLGRYFENNFFLSKTAQETAIKIRIKKGAAGYIFENGSGRCLIKIPFSKIDKAHYWEHLDFVLMLLINSFSLHDDTVLLHGAAYAKNDQGYIFLGPASAGKSTITGQIPKKYIYADDTVVIKKLKNRFFLFPSPFDKKRMMKKELKPVPVGKIYILKQAKKNKTINLSSENKITAILNRALLIEGGCLIQEKKPKKLYRLIFQLADKIETFELLFTKNFNPYRKLIP